MKSLHPSSWVQAFGGGGFTGRAVKSGREGQKGSREAAGAGDALTTGLARAELALEEERELDLRWPLGSEGWPGTQPATGHADRNKGTGQQRCRENGGHTTDAPVSGEVSHAHPGKEGEVSRTADGPGKEAASLTASNTCSHRINNLIRVSKEHRILG